MSLGRMIENILWQSGVVEAKGETTALGGKDPRWDNCRRHRVTQEVQVIILNPPRWERMNPYWWPFFKPHRK